MLKIVNKTVCNTRFGFIAMNGQSKISTFFTQSGTKRSSSGSVSDNADDMKPSPKKLRQTKENVSPGKENKELRDVSLSPEQKSKIEQKKYEALAKLNEKRTNGMLVNVGRTWYNALEEEFKKPYFIELSKFVATERSKGKVFPPAVDVFCWTNYCDIKDVKVVILGQDPYHGPNQAHGLCFSVQKGIQPPPSLQNMFKELENDIPGFKHPGHGTLIGWAKQGVLLLNACLTVRAHQANSHKDKGWEKLTDAVVSWLNKNRSQLVFILWGSYAQKKGAYIDKKKHHILKGVHPSPLSAHRGYFGCKHFSKCNELLKEAGKSTIDWSRLPPQD